MSPTLPTVLAADLGGSSIKAALVSRTGEIVAQTTLPAPARGPGDLIAPTDWWQTFREAASILKRENASAFTRVAAIAVTGVTRTPVVLDANGTALIGAMTARDARAQEIARRTAVDPQLCPEAVHYDAFHPA